MLFFFFENCQSEEWLDIKGYAGLYQVSNLGRVRSVEHTIIMSNGRLRLIRSKILILHKGGTNCYLQAYLHKDCTVRNRLVHRLVASHFIAPIPEGMEINHKNGKVYDNRVENLEIVTHRENIDHSMQTGLFKAIGENHYAAKLTAEDIFQIREQYKQGGVTQYQLAEKYGVCQTHINGIVNLKRRRHES